MWCEHYFLHLELVSLLTKQSHHKIHSVAVLELPTASQVDLKVQIFIIHLGWKAHSLPCKQSFPIHSSISSSECVFEHMLDLVFKWSDTAAKQLTTKLLPWVSLLSFKNSVWFHFFCAFQHHNEEQKCKTCIYCHVRCEKCSLLKLGAQQ